MKVFYSVLLAVLVFACSKKNNDMTEATKVQVDDIHSYARPQEAKVTHLDLDIYVDFENKIISGKTKIHFDAAEDAELLTLDTRGLRIKSIWQENGNEADYELGPEDKILGRPLNIKIEEDSKAVTIIYETGAGAEALQWLSPKQTAGKEVPFLFTQSQAILARTWIPLQDSPGIRFTYTAKVQVPKGMMAVMSAENPQEKNLAGIYEFKMTNPIPSYLMALAVGDLEFRSLGIRTGVYAEPVMIEKSAYELAETEEMLEIAEKLYGPYRWGRYDIIVLPPSFPFGGMENPRITFATPTIIAGDRSLTSLVAHELAHSWSGNLVTNATWSDFWINEGFTVYFENRIMEELYGRDYSEMLAALSQQDLKVEVENFIKEGRAEDTKLKLDLKGRNPDDGVTSIPYDKGYSFLRYLEEYTGRETFDEFLREYFDRHAFQTMTTAAFLDYMKEHLFEKNDIEYPGQEIHQWVYEPGLPETLPSIHSERFSVVKQQLDKWVEGMPAMEIDTAGWTTHEWLHFIKNIPENLEKARIKELDDVFGFTQSGNAEILDVWFLTAIRYNYEEAYPAMEEFLVSTGRRKFLTPLYSAMIKKEATKDLALDIYRKARPNYHFVSVNTLDEILDWKE